eukprot:TRINITY_DN1030_c0_g1_i1.p1 TRINITY_DN1030_c0_g1~~TRINITY_DN1030_c0_g1_i1.p1  ORF type:complete len:215 (+),score=52.04 TRINITY_DN1030_c0_g1_i1:582-1226(+)
MVLVTDQLSNSQITLQEQATLNLRIIEQVGVNHSSVFTNSESFPELNIFDHLSRPSNQKRPSLASLQKQFADHSATLNHLCLELDSLTQKTRGEEESIPETLREEMNELNIVCQEFNQAFSNDVIQMLSNSSGTIKSNASSLGTQVHRLHQLSSSLREMLNNLSKLKSHFSKTNNQQLTSLLKTAQEEQRGISELQESIAALETNIVFKKSTIE